MAWKHCPNCQSELEQPSVHQIAHNQYYCAKCHEDIPIEDEEKAELFVNLVERVEELEDAIKRIRKSLKRIRKSLRHKKNRR